jgi:hypothetical protein
MAIKPLTFGIRLRDKGRTVRVRQDAKRRYVVEDSQKGRGTARRSHGSLGGAIRDAASTWRGRLN